MTIKNRTFFDYIELLYYYSIKRIEDDNDSSSKKILKDPPLFPHYRVAFPRFNLRRHKHIYSNHNNLFFKQTGCCYRLTPNLTKQFNLNSSPNL